MLIIIIIFVLIFISGISMFLYIKNQDDKETEKTILEYKIKADLENKLKATKDAEIKAKQEAEIKAKQEAMLIIKQDDMVKIEQDAKIKADLKNKLKAEEIKRETENINYIIKNNDDKFYTDNIKFITNQNKFLIESVKPLPSLEDIDKYDKVFEQIEKLILLNNQNMLNDDK